MRCTAAEEAQAIAEHRYRPRQNSDISQMIWSVPEIISELSRLFELHAGDIIFTGTPSGVGPVQPGDTLHADIERVGELSLQVYKPS